MLNAKMGKTFYDEANGRYLTIDGIGCDPNTRMCYIEEVAASGELEVVGRGIFTLYELQSLSAIN